MSDMYNLKIAHSISNFDATKLPKYHWVVGKTNEYIFITSESTIKKYVDLYKISLITGEITNLITIIDIKPLELSILGDYLTMGNGLSVFIMNYITKEILIDTKPRYDSSKLMSVFIDINTILVFDIRYKNFQVYNVDYTNKTLKEIYSSVFICSSDEYPKLRKAVNIRGILYIQISMESNVGIFKHSLILHLPYTLPKCKGPHVMFSERKLHSEDSVFIDGTSLCLVNDREKGYLDSKHESRLLICSIEDDYLIELLNIRLPKRADIDSIYKATYIDNDKVYVRYHEVDIGWRELVVDASTCISISTIDDTVIQSFQPFDDLLMPQLSIGLKSSEITFFKIIGVKNEQIDNN